MVDKLRRIQTQNKTIMDKIDALDFKINSLDSKIDSMLKDPIILKTKDPRIAEDLTRFFRENKVTSGIKRPILILEGNVEVYSSLKEAQEDN